MLSNCRCILVQAGTISVGDFHHVLQEVTNFPLRPFVLPFLKANIPLLARDVAALALRAPPSASAASGCQSTLEYLRYETSFKICNTFQTSLCIAGLTRGCSSTPEWWRGRSPP